MTDALKIGQHILNTQPFSRFLGAQMTRMGPDSVELSLPLHDDLLQQNGFAHGGVVSYLADNALTFAGGLVLGPNILTSEFKINYLRPAKGTRLRAEARVRGGGKRQAVTTCDIYVLDAESEEKLCAIAQGTIAAL